MLRTIRVPNGRSVSLAAYVNAWRQVRTSPPDKTFTGWDHFPVEAATILAAMRCGIHDRINRHWPADRFGPDGRDPEREAHMRRCARMANGRNVLRVSDVPPRYVGRLAHRITQAWEV